MVRLLLAPFRIALQLLRGGFRAGYVVARVPVRTTGRIVRVAGAASTVAFLIGVAVGVLLTPVPGARARAALLRRVGRGAAAPAATADDTHTG